MGETTIKVTTEGLKEFATKLETFGIDIGGQLSSVQSFPPVMVGNDKAVLEIANLKTSIGNVLNTLYQALEKVQTDVSNTVLDLKMAGIKFLDGEDHALTEAETLDLFRDVLGGGGGTGTGGGGGSGTGSGGGGGSGSGSGSGTGGPKDPDPPT